MMKNGDHEGQIFQSHPHTNYGFFVLLTTIPHFILEKHVKGFQKNPENAEMRHICDMVMSF